MTTEFINTFFNSITYENFNDEFYSSISALPPLWENEGDKQIYQSLVERSEKGLLDEDGCNELNNWDISITTMFPRLVDTTINEETNEIVFISKSPDELKSDFFKKYIDIQTSKFVEIFSSYDENLLKEYHGQDYIEKINHFIFHFNVLSSRSQNDFQKEITKNIRKTLSRFGLSFNITLENTEKFTKEEIESSEALGSENSLSVNEEEEYPLKKLEYYKNQAVVWQFLPIEDFINVLEFFILNNNKDGVKYMDEQCLTNSIERIYYKNLTRPKGIIKLGKGQVKVVINIFYKLYHTASKRQFVHLVKPFKDIILEHFEFQPNVISKNRIDQNFRVLRV